MCHLSVWKEAVKGLLLSNGLIVTLSGPWRHLVLRLGQLFLILYTKGLRALGVPLPGPDSSLFLAGLDAVSVRSPFSPPCPALGAAQGPHFSAEQRPAGTSP